MTLDIDNFGKDGAIVYQGHAGFSASRVKSTALPVNSSSMCCKTTMGILAKAGISYYHDHECFARPSHAQVSKVTTIGVFCWSLQLRRANF